MLSLIVAIFMVFCALCFLLGVVYGLLKIICPALFRLYKSLRG
ncbi:hypothetical protein SAMN02910356_02608 [Selenomonas sp. GACV-9]|nr:hypothetical protein SAMN02910356_02608 [Selenomonas ruminantium]